MSGLSQLLTGSSHAAGLLSREPMSVVVQSLWIGPRLGRMEAAAMRSHLASGHEFHLYIYDEIENAPDGVVLKDAAAVLPRSEIVSDQDGPGKGSYAAFANYFQYVLLLDRGNWWADADQFCLRPFDFAADHVFSREATLGGGPDIVANCVLKAPAGSPSMEYCREACAGRDVGASRWGELGPRLVTAAVRRFGLDEFLEPPETFLPVPWWRFREIAEARPDVSRSHGLHLWNELWRRADLDKEIPIPGSLYADLLARFA